MRKNQVRYKVLAKQISEAYESRLSHSDTSYIPWGVLAVLVSDQKNTLAEVDFNDVMSSIRQENVSELLKASQRMSDPLKYDSAASYFSAALVASFLKKFPFGKVAGLDPEGKAKERLEIAETRCRISNRRIAYYSNRWYRLKQHDRWLGTVFHNARLKIQNWLGPVDLNEVYDHAKHGPGGTLNQGRPFSTAYFKYAAGMGGYSVSARCLPYAEAAILADPLWARSLVADYLGLTPFDVSTTPALARETVQEALRCTNFNKVTFVPKTAQTHRAIAIEPLMNIYLQLGVGRTLKRRLVAAGCNLYSQDQNQQLALLGSKDVIQDFERPSTMDLEMASDTLCIELVRELLPPDWFQLMSDLRSPFGAKGDGVGIRKWAKFSSMGNGYTFELESLIFYALVTATVEYFHGSLEYVSVYGDDIVVPHYWYPMVRQVLQFAGFRINSEKSFVSGPFRESCGKDYFEGTAVRPFYLKRQIKSRKDLIFLANSLAVFAEATGSTAYAKGCDFVTSRLPKLLRDSLMGPRTEDLEGHLFASFEGASASELVSWNKDLQCWSFPTFRARARAWEDKPKTSFLYLQFMEGVVCMDRFGDDEPPDEVAYQREVGTGSKSRVVLSGGSETRYFDFGLSYRWTEGVENPVFDLPPEEIWNFFQVITLPPPVRCNA